MLAFFRNNRFSSFFLLAFYAILLHMPALLGWQTVPAAPGVQNGGVLYEKLFLPFITFPGFSVGACLFFILLQSLMVNRLADRYRLLHERSWMPGMAYVLMASGLPEFLYLSPALVAVSFVPSSLHRLFGAYNVPQATGLVFDAAFWIACGSLFFPPMLLLLPAAYIGMLIIRSFTAREQLVFVIGGLVPLFLAWLGYFWYDLGWHFVEKQFIGPFGMLSWRTLAPDWLSLGFLLLLLLLAVLNSGSYFYKKLIQIQKCISTMYWFLLFGGVAVLLQKNVTPNDFLIVAPVMGIFAAYSLQQIRKPLMAEVIHLIWLGLVVIIHIFH
ncbi:MAG: hypothetical protein IT270_10145 [Saprospiraceae bacterium]|nr:hypothetical protein [Saprospiraceae bacterium]